MPTPIRTRRRLCALAVAAGLVCASAVGASASNVQYDFGGRIIHKPDISGAVQFVYGDWMGNETFRSAFRTRVTDMTQFSWQWAGSLANSTTSSSDLYCTVPYPSQTLRNGIFDMCVGDYGAYFNSLGYGSGVVSMSSVEEINYQDGSAHATKARALVDAYRANTDAIRRRAFCKTAGSLSGLAYTSDSTNCMSNIGEIPNGHDHAQADAIYNGHNDTWQ